MISLLLASAACGGPAKTTDASSEAATSAETGDSAADPAQPDEAMKQATTESTAHAMPYVLALGTAQDGGLPHAACQCSRCQRARREPQTQRRAASLALVLPASGKIYLFDASPDLPSQLQSLAPVRGFAEARVDRAPVDGVFLTHAHIGHYLGLAFFGFEVVHTQGLTTYCTPRMAGFLRDNGPWSQLVEMGNLELRELSPGSAVELEDGVRVSSLQVPHRDEFSDTVAYRIQGPQRTLLYVPDTDTWETWDPPLLQALDGVDIALLDATFHSLDDLPNRSVASVGHPLVVDSVELLGPRVGDGTLEVAFTHLNHSNPLLNEDSTELEALQAKGFRVLAEEERIDL